MFGVALAKPIYEKRSVSIAEVILFALDFTEGIRLFKPTENTQKGCNFESLELVYS